MLEERVLYVIPAIYRNAPLGLWYIDQVTIIIQDSGGMLSRSGTALTGRRKQAVRQLSEMQQKIYDYVADCIQNQGYPPSVREIGEAVGLRSPSTVHFHLKHLEEAGYISKGAGKGRAISLTRREEVLPPAAKAVEAEASANRVPVVGNVAAGSPILAEECVEDYLAFDTNGRPGEYFALRVRGDSMINAGIFSGDLVVVHQQPTAHNGEIVVALIEDEATVKRLSRKDGHIWLLPENEAYRPIDGTHASILGKVAAVIRRYD